MRILLKDAPAAIRAGVSVVTPLLVVLLLDRPYWSMYAAFGAFTSLYGRTRTGRGRFIMQSGAAAALVLAVALGVLISVLDARTWLAVPIAALIAGAGTALATIAGWHPPGALFLVFAFGAVASVPHHLADLLPALGVAAASAAFSLLVGALHTSGPAPPRVRVKLAHTVPAAVACAASALVAGTIATGFGIGHLYWATVAAVAPLSARGRSAQLVRAAHRITGTLAGLVLAAVLLAPGFGAYPAVAILALLQVAAELVVARNYGLAMLFITPLALLMNQVAAPRPVAGLLWDRGLETLIGVLIAGATILTTHHLTKPP
ncbi:FUSC family protein [Actinoplanes sp. CA-015351]|uniref:FUSC family protein n=1 Tax=Actinoplanes sp. CA-015351 TaxID=3239897 RepID=UPI003D95CF0D